MDKLGERDLRKGPYRGGPGERSQLGWPSAASCGLLRVRPGNASTTGVLRLRARAAAVARTRGTPILILLFVRVSTWLDRTAGDVGRCGARQVAAERLASVLTLWFLPR